MSDRKRAYISLSFCIVAGLVICVTAALGHQRLAAAVTFGAIVLGALSFYLIRARQNSFSSVSQQDQLKSRRVDRVFGWLLVAGVFLHIVAQISSTNSARKPATAGFVVELLFDLVLAFFLLRPNAKRALK